jgi:hypothetical protein
MTKNNAKSKGKKPKQLGLGEGYERKKIAEVETAAEDYRSTRDERMAMQVTEAEKQARLDELLAKHGIKKYVYLDEETGEELEAYVPDKKPLAKVRKVKKNKPDAE